MTRARRVVGAQSLHRRHHSVPIAPLFPSQLARCIGETALMRQHLPHRDLLFPVPGEPRPVGRHRIVPIQKATLPQDVQAAGGQGFGGGVEHEHGAVVDRAVRLPVGLASPEVQRQPAETVHRQSRAGMYALFDLLIEQFRDPLQSSRVHSDVVGHDHHASAPYATVLKRPSGTPRPVHLSI